jgi:MFS family permease
MRARQGVGVVGSGRALAQRASPVILDDTDRQFLTALGSAPLRQPVRERLVDVAGWRSIFFLNAPIAAVALVLAVKIRTRRTLTARCRPRSRWPGSGSDL